MDELKPGTIVINQTFSGDIDPNVIATKVRRSVEDSFRKLYYQPERGTLQSIELAFDRLLDEEECPVGMRLQMRYEIAARWLVQQRPRGFFARLLYAWRVFRVLR